MTPSVIELRDFATRYTAAWCSRNPAMVADRGPQYLAYDFWWHLGHDTMITSEWGTPEMVENGVNPELLLGGKYGHALHVWDLHKRRHQQVLEMGPEHQMALELRPAHDPTEAYGFVGVVTSLKDLAVVSRRHERQRDLENPQSD
jgi:hypothetical protein